MRHRRPRRARGGRPAASRTPTTRADRLLEVGAVAADGALPLPGGTVPSRMHPRVRALAQARGIPPAALASEIVLGRIPCPWQALSSDGTPLEIERHPLARSELGPLLEQIAAARGISDRDRKALALEVQRRAEVGTRKPKGWTRALWRRMLGTFRLELALRRAARESGLTGTEGAPQ